LINSGGGYPDFAILLLARCLQAFVSDRLEALILSEEVGDHRAQVGTLVGLAQLESDAGDLAAAGAYAERALEICRSFDHPDFWSWLAQCYSIFGRSIALKSWLRRP
jgi:hypothetical protein